jgi:hypothetical protein
MTTVKQKVFLITEDQRDGLMNYLMNRPYAEVANGVQFLTNAPTTILNVELPEEKSENLDAEKEPQLETVPFSTDEALVLSHA